MTPTDSLDRLRGFLMAILVLGMLGSAADLLLLRHYEDKKQLIPLALIGTTFVVLAWLGLTGQRAGLRALQLMMGLFISAGFIGVGLHFQSNMEFQLEIDPSLQGSNLLLKVLRAKAPPALAPGVLVQLGLLGLAFTYRHPSLVAADQQTAGKGE